MNAANNSIEPSNVLGFQFSGNQRFERRLDIAAIVLGYLVNLQGEFQSLGFKCLVNLVSVYRGHRVTSILIAGGLLKSVTPAELKMKKEAATTRVRLRALREEPCFLSMVKV